MLKCNVTLPLELIRHFIGKGVNTMNGTDCKEKHKIDSATQQIKYHRTLAHTLHIFYNADILMLILDNANDVRDIKKRPITHGWFLFQKTNVDTYITAITCKILQLWA